MTLASAFAPGTYRPADSASKTRAPIRAQKDGAAKASRLESANAIMLASSNVRRFMLPLNAVRTGELRP